MFYFLTAFQTWKKHSGENPGEEKLPTGSARWLPLMYFNLITGQGATPEIPI
jgi:hypothetical protein